jgi:hypothetical protein
MKQLCFVDQTKFRIAKLVFKLPTTNRIYNPLLEKYKHKEVTKNIVTLTSKLRCQFQKVNYKCCFRGTKKYSEEKLVRYRMKEKESQQNWIRMEIRRQREQQVTGFCSSKALFVLENSVENCCSLVNSTYDHIESMHLL